MNAYGWLKPDEMIQGLALAETTPGPLIMVVQFVAFVGAFRSPGSLDPWLAATLGALITTWVTFVPGVLVCPTRRAIGREVAWQRAPLRGAHRASRPRSWG